MLADAEAEVVTPLELVDFAQAPVFHHLLHLQILRIDAHLPCHRKGDVVFADGTTGISSVQGSLYESVASQSGLKVNGYYDLQGRKVANPQKGLYIVNGKKVIIK